VLANFRQSWQDEMVRAKGKAPSRSGNSPTFLGGGISSTISVSLLKKRLQEPALLVGFFVIIGLGCLELRKINKSRQ